MIGYICKYTPTELYAGFGEEVILRNEECADLSASDHLIHANVCNHAKHLLSVLEGEPEMALINCCDSVRRVYDTLAFERKTSSYLEMIDLPHSDDACMQEGFAKELLRIRDSYAKKSGRSFDRGRFIKAWAEAAEAWGRTRSRMKEGPFLALLGARAGDGFLAMLKEYLQKPVIDLTCAGLRDLAPPPKEAFEMEEEELFRTYARALLSQISCMRMIDTSNRAFLRMVPDLAGVIYNTVRFCDYYEFEYRSLQKELSVPMLKIETDYTSGTKEQLRTRIEAFGERLAEDPGRKRQRGRNDMPKIYVGIDSGSTSTNAVAMNEKKEILSSVSVKTGAKAGAAAYAAMEELCKSTGVQADGFAAVCATGYGREHLSFADLRVTEISCHAKGARYRMPDVRTIVDIGGQDSKVIVLDPDGSVANFAMNDKCAAGTGRFLEKMAETLELGLEEMASLGLSFKEDLTISSTCTVFAESEVVSLVAQDQNTSDVIHALNKAAASRVYSMIQRVAGEAPYLMTGGVANNPSLVRAIEDRICATLTVAEEPELTGAIGAALYALEEE